LWTRTKPPHRGRSLSRSPFQPQAVPRMEPCAPSHRVWPPTVASRCSSPRLESTGGKTAVDNERCARATNNDRCASATMEHRTSALAPTCLGGEIVVQAGGSGATTGKDARLHTLIGYSRRLEPEGFRAQAEEDERASILAKLSEVDGVIRAKLSKSGSGNAATEIGADQITDRQTYTAPRRTTRSSTRGNRGFGCVGCIP